MTKHTASNGQFDKFAWLRAVLASEDFKDGEKVALTYAGMFSVLSGSDTFCVRQSTIAERCSMSLRTVSSAISRGKRLGYLALTRERKPGWGQHGADELRLTLPKSYAKFAHDSTDWSAESAHNPEKSYAKSAHDSAESYAKSAPSHTQNLRIHKEYGFLTSSLREEGVESHVNLTADSDHPPKCPDHPEGPNHDKPCRRCGRWRKWLEDRHTDDLERKRQQRQARRDAIDACPRCDERGMIEVGENSMKRCTHPKVGTA